MQQGILEIDQALVLVIILNERWRLVTRLLSFDDPLSDRVQNFDFLLFSSNGLDLLVSGHLTFRGSISQSVPGGVVEPFLVPCLGYDGIFQVLSHHNVPDYIGHFIIHLNHVIPRVEIHSSHISLWNVVVIDLDTQSPIHVRLMLLGP